MEKTDNEKIEYGAMIEELESLRLENKKIKRKFDLLNQTLERNKLTLIGKANVESVLAKEKSRLEKYMNLMLENAPDIIFLLDIDGRIVYCTDIFLKIAGIKSFGLINGKLYRDIFKDFIDDKTLKVFDETLQSANRTNKTVKLDLALDIGKTKNNKNYQLMISPMSDEYGKCEGNMLLFNDLTEVLSAKLAAEKANNAKTEFLANMSHEIRTPLNAIIGMTNIAIGSESYDKKDECIAKIKQASNHLLGVVNDILDMSKIEAQKFELSESAFNFLDMLNNTLNVISLKAEEKNQILTTHIDKTVPTTIIADSQRLSQVITNLLSNAVKFTPAGGRIEMTVNKISEMDGMIRLAFKVKDTGIGLLEEQKKKLFRPFVQADNSISRKYGGTGLGLVICKTIVNLMGGSIDVESKPDQGSTFSFDIIVKDADEQDIKAKEEINPDDFENRFTGKNILLAEDIELNREIVTELLSYTGVSITGAENGLVAIELFNKDPQMFDLIFMDIHMPLLDGFEAAKRIRDLPVKKAKTIPILAMTANVFKEDIKKCLDCGMNAHIGKPIDLSEVLMQMDKYLRKRVTIDN